MRPLAFCDRRKRLEAFVAEANEPRLDLSPIVRFKSWEELAAARADPASGGAKADAAAVEGIMLKRVEFDLCAGATEGPLV